MTNMWLDERSSTVVWCARKVCSSRIGPDLMGGHLVVCRYKWASEGFGIGLFPGSF